MKVTLPVIRNGCTDKVTVHDSAIVSIKETNANECKVRIRPEAVPEFCDEHLRVGLAHDAVVRLLKRSWWWN